MEPMEPPGAPIQHMFNDSRRRRCCPSTGGQCGSAEADEGPVPAELLFEPAETVCD